MSTHVKSLDFGLHCDRTFQGYDLVKIATGSKISRSKGIET